MTFQGLIFKELDGRASGHLQGTTNPPPTYARFHGAPPPPPHPHLKQHGTGAAVSNDPRKAHSPRGHDHARSNRAGPGPPAAEPNPSDQRFPSAGKHKPFSGRRKDFSPRFVTLDFDPFRTANMHVGADPGGSLGEGRGTRAPCGNTPSPAAALSPRAKGSAKRPTRPSPGRPRREETPTPRSIEPHPPRSTRRPIANCLLGRGRG